MMVIACIDHVSLAQPLMSCCCYDSLIAIRITAERLVELQRATDADSTYIPG